MLVANAVEGGQHLQEVDGEAIKPRATKEVNATAAYVNSNVEQ